MKPQCQKQELTEGHTKSTEPRFRIEKLEERIAPAKGGIAASGGNDRGGPGSHCNWNMERGRCGR